MPCEACKFILMFGLPFGQIPLVHLATRPKALERFHTQYVGHEFTLRAMLPGKEYDHHNGLEATDLCRLAGASASMERHWSPTPPKLRLRRMGILTTGDMDTLLPPGGSAILCAKYCCRALPRWKAARSKTPG